ncbi:ribosome silencing factor [Varibaculum vaginae]|uniref:ribosome silencing factor n=1 Tax=Varibaculum vaginae TaxID=2364797 RepID=UPI000F094072|nr:ribosome silencing factor [Varibaculum vaginae]
MVDKPDPRQLAEIAAKAAASKLATDVVAIDVHAQTIITDIFLICSGDNPRQVRAIMNEIDHACHDNGAAPKTIEGNDEFRWVLMELPGVIVHIFLDEEREYYGLERLWNDCPRIDLPDLEEAARAGRAQEYSQDELKDAQQDAENLIVGLD